MSAQHTQNHLKVLIVEDEEAAVNRLRKELNKMEDLSYEVVAIIDTVSGALQWLGGQGVADLIFMDIHLNDGNSFEIFKQVTVEIPIIFTTAYDEYALQAFRVNSLDYLLKPINPEELHVAIDRFLATQKEPPPDYLSKLTALAQSMQPTTYRSSFLVHFRQQMHMVEISEVAYFYIKERGVFMKKKDGKEYAIEFFLDDLEQQLNPREFYRANRQFLVSRSCIKVIEPYFNGRLLLAVQPESPTQVLISKEKATDFKRWADY
ncbi:MAG: LytTR family DNA-binding domain-containing protein [Bacteroidota bacterium]